MSLPVRRPIVCLPGIRGHRALFGPFVDRVRAAGQTVRALDLPPGAPALAASRVRLDAGPIHVITGSYGGLVARHLPASALASLTCIGTLPHPRHLQPAMARRARVLCQLPDAVLEWLYAVHSGRSLKAEGVGESVRAELAQERLPARVLRGRLRAVFDGRHGGFPAVPTLWVHGADDGQVVWGIRDLKKACPWAEQVEVPGGHFPHATHPATLLEAVRPFWQSAESRRSTVV